MENNLQGRDIEQKTFIQKYCEENNFTIGDEWLNADIQWLSNSSTTDLPLDQWFFRYIYMPKERHKFSRHSRMEFGKYADEYSAKVLLGEMSIKAAEKEIINLDASYIPSTSDLTDKTRSVHYRGQIKNYIEQIIKAIRPIQQTYDEMVTQYPIVLKLDGINCLFIGYLDFAFLKNGKLVKWIELKTMWDNPKKEKGVFARYKKDYFNKNTGITHKANSRIWTSQSLPLEVKETHSPQLAIYSVATEIPGDILYVKENDHTLFEAEDGEEKLQMEFHKDTLKTVRANALARQNLLKMSKDPTNLYNIIQPDFTHWKWRGIEPEYLEIAKNLWLGGNNDQEKK